jgi:putative component of membrane protein insertase Oxa1/YidC/SpoIIIJ protein YidD
MTELIRVSLISILFFTISGFPQTDWIRWEKADYSYEKPNNFRHRDYTFDTGSVSGIIVKSTAIAYWYFISDLDGDNCPYSPSCSAFLVEAVKETNILQGTMMFFDRFTRDYNIHNRHEHYPRVRDGHYYDPVTLYTLDEEKIIYISPSATVTK